MSYFFDKKKKSQEQQTSGNSTEANSDVNNSNTIPNSNSNSNSNSNNSNNNNNDKEEKKKTSTLKLLKPKNLFKKKNTGDLTTSASNTNLNSINESDSITTPTFNSNSTTNTTTTTNNSITQSSSISSTSLRSISNNSIEAAASKRSESFCYVPEETESSDSSVSGYGSSSINYSISSSSNNNVKQPKPKSKLKSFYNTLKFKSLRSEKVSHSQPPLKSSLSRSNFEFIVPSAPLPIFDQQSPLLSQINNEGNNNSSSSKNSNLSYLSNSNNSVFNNNSSNSNNSQNNNNNSSSTSTPNGSELNSSPPMSSQSSYFGVPLAMLIKRQDNGLSVPVLVEKTISFLEGHLNNPELFHKGGNNEKIHHMRSQFEKNGDFNFYYPEIQDPYDVASLLYEFIASLPDQLINSELYTTIGNHISALNSKYGGYWDIQFLVQRLSVESRELLQRLLFFLYRHVKACTTGDIVNSNINNNNNSKINNSNNNNNNSNGNNSSNEFTDKLSALFTPLFINHKSHLLYQPATSSMIERCLDLFVEIEDRPFTFAGEHIMLQVKNVIIPPNNFKINPSLNNSNSSSGSGSSGSTGNNPPVDITLWESGILYITNYRLIWKKDDSNIDQNNFLLAEDSQLSKPNSEFEIKPYQFEIILSSLIKWEIFGKSKASSGAGKSKNVSMGWNGQLTNTGYQMYLCYCKNIRFQYFGFQDDYTMEKLNVILGYYINPIMDFGRFFSSVNHEISSTTTASTAGGWDIYLPFNDGIRLDMDKDFKQIELQSREFHNVYPKKFLVPMSISEEILANYIKKLQSKVPIFTWSNANKAQLYRGCVYQGGPNVLQSPMLSSAAAGGMLSSGSTTPNNITTISPIGTLYEEPQSPAKRKHDRKESSGTFSPATTIKGSLSKSKSKSKTMDSSSGMSKASFYTTILTDSTDLKLFQMFINKRGEQQQQQQQQSTNESPILLSTSHSNSSLNLGNTPPATTSSASLNSSSSSLGGGRRKEAEGTIIFTNKIDINLAPIYEKFKLNSSNIVFLGIQSREEIESHWFDLYKSINCFDGSVEAWKSVEESGWIESLRLLLEGCIRVANILEEGSSVLLKPHFESPHHHLDLASITSITMILSDPYYRTLDGFLQLIEKEWIQYGYPFININYHKDTTNSNGGGIGGSNGGLNSSGSTKRYGSISKGTSVEEKLNGLHDIPDTISVVGSSSSKKKPALFGDLYDSVSIINRSISPVFVHFMDAVWQIHRQFPFHFQFNEYLLLFLIKESFSGRFGNFLFSEAMRDVEKKFLKRTPSIYSYVQENRSLFTNLLYKHSSNTTAQGAGSQSPLSPRNQNIFKKEDFNKMIKPSCENDQILLWSSLFTEFINSRESQQISKKLIGKVKSDLTNLKLTFLQIDRSLLSYFSQLTSLNLSRNLFNTFPSDIILLSNLTHLSLADNRIKSIPSALFKLIGSKLRLIELDLSGNLLESIHKSIYTLSSLTKLVLNNNQLVVIPESISKMKQLKILSVIHNRLSSFPQALSLMVGLEELYVSNNQIRDLPLGFFKLKSIKTLDLRNNQIVKFKPHKLDDKVFCMNEISTFKFGPNPLSKMTQLFFEMKSLTFLQLTSCSLVTIPVKMFELVNLQVLYLNQNKLSEAPLEFANLTNLTALDLSDNQFTTLPTNALVPSLRKLYLQNNTIFSVQFVGFNLARLEELRLDGNRITYVSPSIGKLTNLVSLNLERNQITTLPHTLSALIRLKTLSINTTQMSQPFPTLDTTDSLLKYLSQQSIQTYHQPRGKLVIISDSNLTSKNEIIRNLISNNSKISKKGNSSGGGANIKASVNSIQDINQKRIIKWDIEYDTNSSINNVGLSSIDENGVILSNPLLLSIKNENNVTSLSTTNSNNNNNNTTTVINNNNNNSNNNNLNGIPLMSTPIKDINNRDLLNGSTGFSAPPLFKIDSQQKEKDSTSLTKGNTSVAKKGTMTIYLRDISSIICHCSQHLFTKRAIYLLLWVLSEAEEPVRLYRWLECIKDRCSFASVFVVGVFNNNDTVSKDYFSYISPRIEQRCQSQFPNFAFSFQSIGVNNENLPKLREDIKYAFTNQKVFGSRVSSAQKLFEKHLKTLQTPYISKREINTIGDMCGLDKIATKNVCELLSELGLLLWLDDYEWVVLDPLWLTTAFSSLLTLKQNNMTHSSSNGSIGISPSLENNSSSGMGGGESPLILPPKRDIIVMNSLESIWSDIPVKLYPYLLTLAKKHNIAYVIDTLYDPSTWGYTYGLLHSKNSSPTLRGLTLSRTGSSSSPSKFSLSPLRSGSSSSNIFSPTKQYRYENLKILADKVIFLPNELPDAPPIPIDKMFPSDEPRSISRIFQFEQKIPSSFFPRLLSQLYVFCSIRYTWKTGVVLENCNLSFPVNRRFPSSPNIKHLRRSSTISVLSSEDLVCIQLFPDNRIEISSTKMFRHILQIFESILDSYRDIQYATYIPCGLCIESKVRQENQHLFKLEQIESAVIKGKTYVSCSIHSSIPIKLNQLAPDLTMNDLKHKLIDFVEVALESDPIGEGGTATVYKGLWRGNNVAVKLLKTNDIGNSFSKVFTEFRREIFCMSSFIHSNILDLKGFCLEPLCIITEFQSGGNLYDYIHDLNNPLDWKLRIKIAKEIASSMQTLHDTKPSVVHRDLKSPNILLSSKDPETMTCQLCDFSLSGFSTSVANRAVENPVWLAPEVIANEFCSDKSDVYAFGVILFELLARVKFFQGITFMSTVEQLICEGVRPSLPIHDLPQYDLLLNACWAQESSSRPSFTEILRRLDEIELIIDNNPIISENQVITPRSLNNNNNTTTTTTTTTTNLFDNNNSSKSYDDTSSSSSEDS